MSRTGKLLLTSSVPEVANDEPKQETKVLKVYIVLQFDKVIIYSLLHYEILAIIILYICSLAIFKLKWLQKKHILALSLVLSSGI